MDETILFKKERWCRELWEMVNRPDNWSIHRRQKLDLSASCKLRDISRSGEPVVLPIDAENKTPLTHFWRKTFPLQTDLRFQV